MNANPTPNPNHTNATVKPIPWGKKYRMPLMNASFWLFWIGFPLAYIGGTKNDEILITLSYVAFGAACILPLLTKK